LASNTNQLIDSTDGTIIFLTLKASDEFEGGDIVLSNVLCTSPDATTTHPTDYVLHLDCNTTEISETEIMRNESYDRYYNLSGQRISKPRKGVNVINGKKLIK
jgi:hypothetical protein